MRIKFNTLLLFMLVIMTNSQAFAATYTFSFASDSDTDGTGPILKGNGCLIEAASPIKVELLADTNADFPGGVVSLYSELKFRGKIRNHTVTPMYGNFVHTWEVTGGMQLDGGNVLTIRFNNALLTSYSRFPNRLGESMTLQDNEAVDHNIRLITGPLVHGLGIPDLHFNEEFALTFTKITNPVFLGACFANPWESETSFSANADS